MAEANITTSGVTKGSSVQKLLLVIGQSFVPGREPIANLNVAYSGEIKKVSIYNGSTFEALNSTLNNNQYLGVNGPPTWAASSEYGYTFYLGKDLADYYGKHIWYGQYGVGGTVLGAAASPTWLSTVTGSLFTNCKTHITNMYNHIRGLGLCPELDVIWDQGYGDSTVQAYANAYATNLEAFITAVNAHIENYQNRKPFWYINRVSVNYGGLTYASTVRSAQATVVNNDTAYRRLIDIDSAPLQNGDGHPNDAGNIYIANAVKTAYIADH